jgi:hypothetical protein
VQIDAAKTTYENVRKRLVMEMGLKGDIPL